MFFKKKVKPVQLRAYTWDDTYLNFNKPLFKNKERPDWFKRLSPTVQLPNFKTEMHTEYSTVAFCPGIKGFLNLPIQINAWCDMEFRIRPDRSWDIGLQDMFRENVSEHPAWQIGNDAILRDRIFLKLNSPWAFTCDEDIEFLAMEPFYSTTFYRDNGIINPPGILEFKHQVSSNVHLSFPIRSEPYNVQLKMGTPLLSMFPLTDRPVEIISYESIPGEKFQKLTSFPKVNLGRYYVKLKMLRDANKS
jgi:hypothetical protein